MERRMLINAIHSQECRIANVEDNVLLELEIESNAGRKLKGNIYKAKIARIEPSLQAAFIDIGTSRNGFLQINDLHPAYFQGHNDRGSHHPRIQDVLEQGQEIVVQVVKEERELKGATLTTFLSLPGRYVVVMPGSDRGGISRKIIDREQRQRLRNLSAEVEIPVGMGLIVRTAGLNRSMSELARDASMQLKLWEKIVSAAQTTESPVVLYKESDLATRVIRDYFTPEVKEILIDDEDTFQRVKEFVDEVMPRYRSRVKRYTLDQPIFSHFGIEGQVASSFKREVALPSGGALIIDSLEALVAIDVNSGKATAGGDIEDTAFKTNLEAADEVARQLRLRDLGGLIVIDFIDMISKRHRTQVENRLAEAIRSDKARVEIGHLSKFGLLEMSRQRLRASLSSQSHITCPGCKGTGEVRNPELVALETLRTIQSAIVVGHVGGVRAKLNPSAALFLLNEKKTFLVDLERNHGTPVIILADGRLRVDEVEFEMIPRRDGSPIPEALRSSSPQPPTPPEEDDDDRDLLDEEELRGTRRDEEDEKEREEEISDEQSKASKEA